MGHIGGFGTLEDTHGHLDIFPVSRDPIGSNNGYLLFRQFLYCLFVNVIKFESFTIWFVKICCTYFMSDVQDWQDESVFASSPLASPGQEPEDETRALASSSKKML